MPSGCNFTIIFPSAITALNFSSIIYLNSTITMINSSSVTTTTLSFIYSFNMPIGTSMIIPFAMRTPANLGTYGPLSFRVVKNNNIYEQSNFLKFFVNQTSPIDVLITSPNAYGYSTGASTTLQFTLSSYIAHSIPYFFFLISFPNDTTFNPNITCSGACSSTYSMSSNTVINVTINNSYSFASNFYNYSVVIGSFRNPRSVGSSLSWSF